jgi:hypothetical protein
MGLYRGCETSGVFFFWGVGGAKKMQEQFILDLSTLEHETGALFLNVFVSQKY